MLVVHRENWPYIVGWYALMLLFLRITKNSAKTWPQFYERAAQRPIFGKIYRFVGLERLKRIDRYLWTFAFILVNALCFTYFFYYFFKR